MGAENVVGLTIRDVVEPEKSTTRQSIAAESTGAARNVESGADSSKEGGLEVVDLELYPPPTKEERTILRKVHGSIPIAAWSLCFVELAERASYYGVKAVFNNFIQFPLPEGGPGTGAINPNKPNGHAGALGMGVQTASALTLLFTFLAYIIPIFGAWIADTKIGRYKTIVWGVLIGGLAHIIMRYVAILCHNPVFVYID